jgi:hypothetical protein
MSPSSPDRPRPRRRGITILEVLIAFGILLAVALPLTFAFSTANRIGFASNRQVNGVLQGQVLLDALHELTPDELPPLGSGETVLLDDAGGGVGATGNLLDWDVLAGYFVQSRGNTPSLRRRVLAEALADGAVGVTVELEWSRHPTQDDNPRQVSLYGAVQPRLFR